MGVAGAAEVPDFVREIQPVLEEHCGDCHGADRQRGGYRLDVREIALRGGESQEAGIVPGDPQGSALLERVTSQDPDRRMPPRGERLDEATVGLLRAWIAGGAPWPDHATVILEDPLDWWSLRPLEQPKVPVIAGGESSLPVRTPVDAFLFQRWAALGVVAGEEADRRTLIRRLSYNLIGLPPSPEEVAAFEADQRPDAYERLVERLLASPHYGERWARHWLDVVHYGDTHGYDKDQPRPNAWPYRDYVIRAFNEDKPYGRFVREQVAGDVLYPHTADGVEALGFMAAGPWDFIGHIELPESKIDGKMARHLDRDNMVANTLGTFASLTVHCAQCHDHKFDPIPQEDYFRLQAVFSALDRTDRTYHREPELDRERTRLEEQLRQGNRERQALEKAQAEAGGETLRELDRRLAELRQAAGRSLPPEYGWHSAIAAQADTEKWVQVDLGAVREFDRVVLVPAHDDFNGIGAGFGFPRRFRVESAEDADFLVGVQRWVDRTEADQANPGTERQEYEVAGGRGRYVRVTATRLAPRQDDFIFALAELEVIDGTGDHLARGAEVTALDSIEAPVRWARQNLTDGKAPGLVVDASELPRLEKEREQWLERQVPLAVREGLVAVRARQEATGKALAALPEPLRVYAGTVHHGSGNFRGTGPDGGRPRPIHVLARGSVTQPGRVVTPGALRCVTGVPGAGDFGWAEEAPEGARRAALAEWLTHRDNPLPWRSMVNRVWQYHFGVGLVSTPNDFGRMGSLPADPALLDWLAVEFRDGGQSIKALHRWLVLSTAYRLKAHPGSAESAPPGRMTRRRLDAEAIRDSLLVVSGKLDPAMYGPGFQDFVVEKPEHSPHYQYHLHDADDPRSHRRAVYRFLVRSQQEPFMTAMDCADPSMRVDRRNETLTPLQALALMNSPLTVAMARHWARRLEEEAGDEPGRQVDRAFELLLQRAPTVSEREATLSYLGEHGLAALARLLFNLNEFVFID